MFDRDIGWMSTESMSSCTCGHFQKSHRPISRKCSLCDCLQFVLQKATPPPVVPKS